jgi:hypothetical protein
VGRIKLSLLLLIVVNILLNFFLDFRFPTFGSEVAVNVYICGSRINVREQRETKSQWGPSSPTSCLCLLRFLNTVSISQPLDKHGKGSSKFIQPIQWDQRMEACIYVAIGNAPPSVPLECSGILKNLARIHNCYPNCNRQPKLSTIGIAR